VLWASSLVPASLPGPAEAPAPAAWTALAARTRLPGHPARWQPGISPLSRLGQTPAGHNQCLETWRPGIGRHVPRIYGSGSDRTRCAQGPGRLGRQPSPDRSQGTARRGPSTSAPPRPRHNRCLPVPVMTPKSAPGTHSAQDAVTLHPVLLRDHWAVQPRAGLLARVPAGKDIAARRRPDPAAGYRRWGEQRFAAHADGRPIARPVNTTT
jgi:hypothetical protein